MSFPHKNTREKLDGDGLTARCNCLSHQEHDLDGDGDARAGVNIGLWGTKGGRATPISSICFGEPWQPWLQEEW